MKSLQQTVTIVNKLGFHLRAAAQFIKLANTFKAEIQVEREGKSVNGKSIMGLMTLAAPCGSMVTVVTQGKEARQALDALVKLIHNRFGEKA